MQSQARSVAMRVGRTAPGPSADCLGGADATLHLPRKELKVSENFQCVLIIFGSLRFLVLPHEGPQRQPQTVVEGYNTRD